MCRSLFGCNVKSKRVTGAPAASKVASLVKWLEDRNMWRALIALHLEQGKDKDENALFAECSGSVFSFVNARLLRAKCAELVSVLCAVFVDATMTLHVSQSTISTHILRGSCAPPCASFSPNMSARQRHSPLICKAPMPSQMSQLLARIASGEKDKIAGALRLAGHGAVVGTCVLEGQRSGPRPTHVCQAQRRRSAGRAQMSRMRIGCSSSYSAMARKNASGDVMSEAAWVGEAVAFWCA